MGRRIEKSPSNHVDEGRLPRWGVLGKLSIQQAFPEALAVHMHIQGARHQSQQGERGSHRDPLC